MLVLENSRLFYMVKKIIATTGKPWETSVRWMIKHAF